METLRFATIPLLMLFTALLWGRIEWTETTKITASEDYLSKGHIVLEGEIDVIWKILTDYEEFSSWLPRGLDSSDGGKLPAFIQGFSYHPEWPALELFYGIRILGLLRRDNLSVLFAIEEVKSLRGFQIVLTLTREYPFVSKARYSILLFPSGTLGTTEALFSVRTKLPPLIRFLLPKSLYVKTAHHFLEKFIENLAQRIADYYTQKLQVCPPLFR